MSKLAKNLLNAKRGREKKKKKGSLNQPEPEPSSSFSLTPILSEASVVLSLAIKEELMALVNKQAHRQQNTQTQIPVSKTNRLIFFLST